MGVILNNIYFMDEGLKQIGERLKGLRDVLNLSAEDVANTCGIPVDRYNGMEKGEGIKASDLHKIAKEYNFSLDALMFGEEGYMSSYFLTRFNKGMTVERRKAYKYQSLGAGFKNRKMEPFMVTVEPIPADTPLTKNSHPGQEFDIVHEGRMELTIGDKILILETGDSIYFDSSQPHCMRALDGKTLRFLAVAI